MHRRRRDPLEGDLAMDPGSAAHRHSASKVSVDRFPELAKLRDNWETIRDEAVKLFDEGFIRPTAKNNDWGFLFVLQKRLEAVLPQMVR